MTALLAAAVFFSCGQSEKLIDKVFVMNIKPGDDQLKAYLDYHRNVWPEVEKGFTLAGYEKIRLFRSHHTVVMVIAVPEGADLAAMGKKAESYDKRCAEWNRLMAGYQEGVAGTAPGETWTEAAPFYEFSRP
ncbi:L-rhamnose mutarotase [Chitinophaga lutea]|nr:L-rhamnose mutarotase [Chitinophaga lutea]